MVKAPIGDIYIEMTKDEAVRFAQAEIDILEARMEHYNEAVAIQKA